MFMNLFKRVHKRLSTDFYRAQYMRTVTGVLNTPRVEPGTSEFLLLSMVHHRDVLSYLVAAKSFLKHAPAQRVVVVCDPSITDADRAIFTEQIPHIELRKADEFTHPNIPRGGTWERLFAISEYTKTSYVVQLDADTITTQAVPEVVRSIQMQRGFVLGEMADQTVEPLAVTSARASTWLNGKPHIQASVEAAMAGLPFPDQAMYVRGCSGFCGFPVGPSMRDNLLGFSKIMMGKFGSRWAEWGTEQITSNYLVANYPGTQVLPFPKYSTPDVANESSAFVHFIGSLRFVSSKYTKLTKEKFKN